MLGRSRNNSLVPRCANRALQCWGMNVSQISNGDYIKVKNVDFGSEGRRLRSQCCSWNHGGSIELRLDALNGQLIGTLPVSYTGGWDTWQIKATAISDVVGVHDLFFVFRGNAKEEELFKFDFEFRTKR